MKVQEKLDFLSMAEEFEIEKLNQNEFEIRFKDYLDDNNLTANICGEEVTYYVTGVYNSSSDYAKIDIEKLDNLKKFVEFVTRSGDE